MRRLVLAAVIALGVARISPAQWTLLNSGTTADLRGIHYAGNGVAWAGGNHGTIIRTENEGETWLPCAVPPGADQLDFRGIQSFDAKTAVVMSSGTGDLSRIYKTTDACKTWRLIFTNPDKKGFWDALLFSRASFGTLIGDQVRGHFPVFYTRDGGETWLKLDVRLNAIDKTQSIFAASNSSLLLAPAGFSFVTGGGATTFIDLNVNAPFQTAYMNPALAIGKTAGGFSLASRNDGSNRIIVAVGGDYKQPDERNGTAAHYVDDGNHNFAWRAATTLPGGYRSAVAWFDSAKTWIAVGPNGTDISTDGGGNWKPLTGEPATDKNWNALSLPFVVGPGGRIGKLISAALEK